MFTVWALCDLHLSISLAAPAPARFSLNDSDFEGESTRYLMYVVTHCITHPSKQPRTRHPHTRSSPVPLFYYDKNSTDTYLTSAQEVHFP